VAPIHFLNVGKQYGDGTRAVSDFSLEVSDGEFMVLVGPSGCGKTTALRMIAGLESVTEGEIRIGSRRVNDLAPRDRDVAMVFQNYALYPQMTAFQNIAFGLKIRHVPRSRIGEQVRSISETLGLVELLKRRPGQLSGGQRQRVAMARAMVRDPEVFLMDEPLSNLDANLRVTLRAEISRIHRDLGTTTVFVTHDQIEAMTMGTRIAVMHDGRLQQVGSPQDVYDHPVNLFVGRFVGSPSMNVVEGTIERSTGSLHLRLGDSCVVLPDEVVAARPRLAAHEHRSVAIGIRPECLLAGSAGEPAAGRLDGTVEFVEALGFEHLVHIRIGCRRVGGGTGSTDNGNRDHESTSIVVARLASGVSVQPGERFSVRFAPEKLHFFDLETGDAIRA